MFCDHPALDSPAGQTSSFSAATQAACEFRFLAKAGADLTGCIPAFAGKHPPHCRPIATG
jgi:hypothetical protein